MKTDIIKCKCGWEGLKIELVVLFYDNKTILCCPKCDKEIMSL